MRTSSTWLRWPADRLRANLAGRTGHLRLPLLVSLGNQALSSGGNFVLGIYLARAMPLADFGLYGMCYAACLLYVGIGNALILTRMSVVLSGLPAATRDSQAARMLVAVLLLGSLLLAPAALLAAAQALAPGLSWLPPRAAALLGTLRPLPLVALAAALFLCTEFFIAYAYLRRREGGALAVNAITMLVLAAGLAALHAARIPPTPEAVLSLYALGAALAACAAYSSAPLVLRGSLDALRADWRPAWRDGRWALGGVATTWLQTQTYTYALALLLGPAGAGLANLARLFISPFSFLLPAVNKVAVPRLAELRLSDPARMRRLSLRLTAALTTLALLYSALLYGCFGLAEQALLGRAVPGLGPLAAIWCVVLVFQVMRSGGSILLQIQLRFRVLTLYTLPSAAVTVLATPLLAGLAGAQGALLGLLAGELTLTLLIWRDIRHGQLAAHAEHGHSAHD
ncbi:hypothetical protein [Pseudoduganella namucuonensis]|uniref:Membrane protein involved in the export of O-antigen and teichoic acid n=1 Tax=Pseudoduganella namucuonensis TaxID=1035707 RepID=A0A1I7K2T4_9BURK|nr:hypothetical protein [Pseudoduganella namucuonensis]SFU91675.1 Membrane protein involved in the export of O-antigen and teichoic acid [Pseudoduganella namucuonensis]